MMITALLAFALLPSAVAGETPAVKHARPQELHEALKDFVTACIGAFQKSQGDSVSEMAQELCQCTADEAKDEKVAPEKLRSETAEIRKDPKYQLQDKKLLESFHICTADAMIDADHRSREQEKPEKQEKEKKQ